MAIKKEREAVDRRLPIYLDCNATTPLDPEVAAELSTYLLEDFGNAGSRTHEYGARAKRAVERAREQLASVVGAKRDEVVFTSGATEANNLAILGLAPYGEVANRRHIISTAIEHKAVLEPLQALVERGFEVTLLPVTSGGWVEPSSVRSALRSDTLLVSVMQANNETGVLQPVTEIADALIDHPAFFHVDAAQGFGKELSSLRNSRVDLVSISGHKVFAPKGIGALVARRRGFERPPLTALLFGGGQERGLRPGTLPVFLIAALGRAAALAASEHEKRAAASRAFRRELLAGLGSLKMVVNGDPDRCLAHVLNISIEGVDSEAAIVAVKDFVAISNGSACTSESYEPSHVLRAMGLTDERIGSALRFSWSHLTPRVDWKPIATALAGLVV